MCWGMVYISVSREDIEEAGSAFLDKVSSGPLKTHQCGESPDLANRSTQWVVIKLGQYLGRLKQLCETGRQG